MRKILSILLLVLLPITSPAFAQVQSYEHLREHFKASDLTREDKRFLQTALAFEGHYYGLLDGDWGRLSREAMAKYSRLEFGSASEEWHMAVLAISFFERFERDGWDLEYFPDMRMSVLLPKKTIINDPPTKDFVNLRHSESSLSISLGLLSKATAQRVHDFTMGSHDSSTDPYSVRKPNFAISYVTKIDGSLLYARSDFTNGLWSTVLLSAQPRDASILSAVSSSLTRGRASQLAITPNGRLEVAIYSALAILEKEKRNRNYGDASTAATTSQEPEQSGGLVQVFLFLNLVTF